MDKMPWKGWFGIGLWLCYSFMIDWQENILLFCLNELHFCIFSMNQDKVNFYDFIVVGAGPIGSTLALNLNNHGFRVLILEKKSWGHSNSPYLNGVSEIFSPLLSKLKIYDAIMASKINNGNRVILTTPQGTSLEGEWEEKSRRIFFCREEFDLLLRHRIQQKQIEFIDQAQAVTPIWEKDRVIGIQCTAQGRNLYFFSKLVCGCDGPQSRLAKTIGLESSKSEFHHLYQGRLYSNTQFKGHLISIFPSSKRGQLLLAFSVDHRKPGDAYVELETDLNHAQIDLFNNKAGMEASFQEILLQSSEASKAMQHAIPQADWKIISSQGTHRSKLHLPGIVLLGDAACCVDPIGSSGLLLGLQGIEELLEVILCQEEWDFVQWEQHYLKRVRDLHRFTQMLRFILKRPWLLQYVVKLLNQNPLHKKTFLEVFNGLQSYAEFLNWNNQLRFWLSACKTGLS